MLMKLAPNPEIAGHPERARRVPRTGTVAPARHAWLRTLQKWMERRRQRHALALLDDRLLADIGLTRYDVAQEVAKPFWR